MILRVGTDTVNRDVSPLELLFLAEPDADRLVENAVHDKPAGQGEYYGRQAAGQLGDEADPAQAPQGLLPKDTGGDTAPGTDHAMQRPDAEHIVDLQVFLLVMKTVDKDD